MGMGILLAGLSGAGNSYAQSMDERTKFANEEALMKERADLELEKAKSLSQFNMTQGEDQANRLRTQQQQRIGDAQKILTQQLIAKKANSENDYTSPEDNTPATFEQLQDEDANNPAYQPTAAEKRDLAVQAATQTGDIKPYEAAQLNSKGEIAQLRQESYMDRTQMMGIIQDTKAAASKDRGDMLMAIAQLKVDNASDKNNGTALTKNVAMLKGLGYTDTDIKNFIFEKKESSLSDLATKLYTSDTNFGSKHMTVEDAVAAAAKMRSLLQSAGGEGDPAKPTPSKPVPNPALPAFDPAAFMKKN